MQPLVVPSRSLTASHSRPEAAVRGSQQPPVQRKPAWWKRLWKVVRASGAVWSRDDCQVLNLYDALKDRLGHDE